MAWRHGTTTGYSKHRCRCDLCAGAWRSYQRAYMRERYRGEARTVPVTETRRHIRFLLSKGWTRHAIACAAGMSHEHVFLIAAGKRRRVRRITADRILSVKVDDRPEDAETPAADAAVLIDAMRAAGVQAKTISGVLKVTAPARIRKQQRVRPLTRQKLLLGYRYLARQGLVPAGLLEEVGA